MSISFACNNCGDRYEVAEELAGKRGRCPRCGTFYVIPDRSMPPPPPAEPDATRGSIYGLATLVGNRRAPRHPREQLLYGDPDRLRGGRRERSRLMPLAILLLLLVAGAAYLYRDVLRQWFAEEREAITEKIQEELHPAAKEDLKTAPAEAK